jgi:sigma-54 dependent transcriptional regulator, acetoin dehydrogenase operon transcriptional activator AcoR
MNQTLKLHANNEIYTLKEAREDFIHELDESGLQTETEESCRKCKEYMNQVLLEYNNQLAATLSAVSDGVVYVKNERIIQINKTMSDFIGRPESEVINMKVGDAIMGFPSIEESLKRIDEDNHVEIMITGAMQNYNCLLTYQSIDEQATSYVLIFTRTEEIQMLARKINKYSAFFTFDHIIGKSFKIREVVALARKASLFNYKVIIEGESGVGKEMFAQAIHNNSPRKNKPFIAVDCGAVPHELLESELFGYEENPFFGVRREVRPGKFELANGGTIFLDAISNMPMEIQAKMLRVLQDEKITRVGSNASIPLDVRVIAASASSLEREVRNGNFREDLFYRLNVVFIKIPPLLERKEDIHALIDHFLKKSEMNGKLTIDKKALDILERYSWPGNVRQLHNAVERAIMMCDGNCIKREHFSLDILGAGEETSLNSDEIKTLDEVIHKYVKRILDYTGGNISETARILNISRSTIYNYLNIREN